MLILKRQTCLGDKMHIRVLAEKHFSDLKIPSFLVTKINLHFFNSAYYFGYTVYRPIPREKSRYLYSDFFTCFGPETHFRLGRH
jgi:hypothetical protein